MITVLVNGEEKELIPQTILDYIKLINLEQRPIVVEHNSNIVQKENWAEVFLHDNDTLEIVTFVSGG
jgi:sulfur carrier protein